MPSVSSVCSSTVVYMHERIHPSFVHLSPGEFLDRWPRAPAQSLSVDEE